MKAKCPKCGWITRELVQEEVEMVKEGRLRCSGDCQLGASAGLPLSFPPKLLLEDPDAIDRRSVREHSGGRHN
jgi:hypothetical protein